jgi:hypothetical protein
MFALELALPARAKADVTSSYCYIACIDWRPPAPLARARGVAGGSVRHSHRARPPRVRGRASEPSRVDGRAVCMSVDTPRLGGRHDHASSNFFMNLGVAWPQPETSATPAPTHTVEGFAHRYAAPSSTFNTCRPGGQNARIPGVRDTRRWVAAASVHLGGGVRASVYVPHRGLRPFVRAVHADRLRCGEKKALCAANLRRAREDSNLRPAVKAGRKVDHWRRSKSGPPGA